MPFPAGAETMASRLHQAKLEGVFTAPAKEEVVMATEYFVQLFKGQITPLLKDQWNTLGFSLEKRIDGGKAFLVLQEKRTEKKGRGFYLFAVERTKDIALMVPHGFKDIYTDEIGMHFAKEGDFMAIAWNTRPRYKINEKGESKQDMAKNSRSYFTAFTRAFARTMRLGKIIQLHGFMKARRKTIEGSSADMIISTGSRVVRPDIVKISNCLQANTPYAVKVYPRDIKELGGTSNSSADILWRLGHQGFIHLSLCRPVREWLRKDRNLRKILIDCLEKY